MPSYRLIAAGIALLLYFIVAAIILAHVLGKGALDSSSWEQVVVVFNAVGAIATTAAGVLLGVEIQHASTQQADRKVDAMKGQLDDTRTAAVTALSHLDTTDPAVRDGDGVTAARTTLLGALAPRASD